MEIDRAEPRRGAFEEVRNNYLTTVEGIEGRSRSIESIEHRADSIPDRNDSHADRTVEAAELVESDRQPSRGKIEKIWRNPEPLEPVEKTKDQDCSLTDLNGGTADEQHEDEKAVEASPLPLAPEIDSAETLKLGPIMEGTQRGDDLIPHVDDDPLGEQHTDKKAVEVPPVPWAMEISPEETLEPGPARKGTRIPWLRVLMVLLYLGAVGALVVSESSARKILRDARAKESALEHEAAFGMYREVLDGYPFSFGTIEAKRSLRRMSEAGAFEMPEPSWLASIENLLGAEGELSDVHLLPFVVWPVSAVLLLLVFVTRIFRPSVAFMALLLMAVAIAGSIAQFASYGSISLPPVAGAARGLMRATPAVYVATYLLLALTALMTLTAPTKRPAVQTEEVEELWETIDPAREQ
ncbi:MAG: hypothetical protein ACYSWO_04335 [Planctomycetota bacterium]